MLFRVQCSEECWPLGPVSALGVHKKAVIKMLRMYLWWSLCTLHLIRWELRMRFGSLLCFMCAVFPALINSPLIVDAMIKRHAWCRMYVLSSCRLVMYVIVTWPIVRHAFLKCSHAGICRHVAASLHNLLIFVAKHTAYDLSIVDVPVGIADGAPGSIDQQLHPTFIRVVTAHQTDVVHNWSCTNVHRLIKFPPLCERLYTRSIHSLNMDIQSVSIFF